MSFTLKPSCISGHTASQRERTARTDNKKIRQPVYPKLRLPQQLLLGRSSHVNAVLRLVESEVAQKPIWSDVSIDERRREVTKVAVEKER